MPGCEGPAAASSRGGRAAAGAAQHRRTAERAARPGARRGSGPADIPDTLRDAGERDGPASRRSSSRCRRPTARARTVPALAVGSIVDIRLAGPYELYFVFPLEREQEILDLVQQTFAGRRVRAGAAGRRGRVRGHPAGGGAGPAGGPDRRGAGLRPAGPADAGARRGRPGPAGPGVQRDGRQPGAADPPAGGAVPGAAPVRLRRLARAAHTADHDPDGQRGAPRARGTSFDPALARSAELLQAQLDRFESLLADLLEISRFDAGAAVLEAEPVDVRDVVARVVDVAGPAGRAPGNAGPGARCRRALRGGGRLAAGRADRAQPGRQRDRARRGPPGGRHGGR